MVKKVTWTFHFGFVSTKHGSLCRSGFYDPKTHTIHVNLSIVELHIDNTIDYRYPEPTEEDFENYLGGFLSYLFCHEYTHAVLTNFVNEETSALFDNVSRGVI